MSAAGMARQKQALPPPLVRMVRHPLRWLMIFIITLVTGVVIGHLGPSSSPGRTTSSRSRSRR